MMMGDYCTIHKWQTYYYLFLRKVKRKLISTISKSSSHELIHEWLIPKYCSTKISLDHQLIQLQVKALKLVLLKEPSEK